LKTSSLWLMGGGVLNPSIEGKKKKENGGGFACLKSGLYKTALQGLWKGREGQWGKPQARHKSVQSVVQFLKKKQKAAEKVEFKNPGGAKDEGRVGSRRGKEREVLQAP